MHAIAYEEDKWADGPTRVMRADPLLIARSSACDDDDVVDPYARTSLMTSAYVHRETVKVPAEEVEAMRQFALAAIARSPKSTVTPRKIVMRESSSDLTVALANEANAVTPFHAALFAFAAVSAGVIAAYTAHLTMP